MAAVKNDRVKHLQKIIAPLPMVLLVATLAHADPPAPAAKAPTSAKETVRAKKDTTAKVQVESVALGARVPGIDLGALNAQAVRHARRGDLLLREGQMPGAAQEYARAALAAPRHPMPRLAAGIVLSEIGESKRASEQFRQALRLAEDDAIIAFLLQNALREQGDAQQAQEMYQDVYRRFAVVGKSGLDTSGSVARLQSALATWSDSPVLNLLLGDAYQLAEDFPKADAAYRRAVQLAPGWCKPRVNLGLSLLAQDKTEQAIATFEAALALDPRNAQARLGKGEGQLRSGRNREALTTFQFVAKSAVASPQVAVQAMNGIGQAFANTGRYEEAVATLNRAQITLPNDPAAPTLLGEVRMYQGDARGAVSAYQTALNLTRNGGLSANHSELLRALVEAQLAANRPQEALATLEQALREEPDSSALWHRLAARAHQKLGQTAQAQQSFADALGAESEAYPLDTLRAIDAAHALDTLKATFTRDVDDPNGAPGHRVRAISALAHLARYEGDASREIALRKRLIAARHAPRGWDWFLLAEVYDQKLGQPAAAREAYQKALQIGGLSNWATRFAKQRNKSLTEPMYNPK